MKPKNLAKLCKESYSQFTFSTNGCEVLVVKNDHYQIVIARGTKGIIDLTRDARVFPWYDKDCGWCHSGFLKGGQRIAKKLKHTLDKTKPVIFTGHSLGGALSLIAALKLSALNYNVFKWVGIASPKLFLFRGRKFLKFSTKNYRNKGDIIPTSPRLYSHDYAVIQLGYSGLLNIDDHAIDEYIESLENHYE